MKIFNVYRKETSHKKKQSDVRLINSKTIIEELNQVASEAAEFYLDEPYDYKGRRITPKNVLKAGQSLRHMDVIIKTVEYTVGEKILDVGIAYGFYDVVLKRQFGFNVSGIDHPDNIETYCRYPIHQGIPVLPCDLHFENIPFPDDEFDTIIASEIIEHLLCPPKVLFTKIFKVLRRGGRLIVTTPNFASLRNILLLATGKNPTASFPQNVTWSKEKIIDPRVHPREYTVNEVKSGLSAAGFEVLSMKLRMNQPQSAPSLFLRAVGTIMRILPKYREGIVAIGIKH